MPDYTIHHGDCLDVLKGMADNSVDSIVTDPPYGLSDHGEAEVVACMTAWLAGEVYTPKGKGFMGKSWDSWVPGPEVWRECFRVLKPGGYMIVFASTRTDDLMSMACRLAGFRKHPAGVYVFGSGFPKATNLSKAFDKEAGAVRVGTGEMVRGGCRAARGGEELVGGTTSEAEKWKEITVPATEVAKQWDGWYYGLQSLKPAMEPWLMFQKPHEGRMTDNVQKWGTGAINVDACRVATVEDGGRPLREARRNEESDANRKAYSQGLAGSKAIGETEIGRWPANLLHSGEDCVVAMFPAAPGQQGKSSDSQRTQAACYGATSDTGKTYTPRNDTGSAARFFNTFPPEEHDPLHYCAKASKADREEGLEHFESKALAYGNQAQAEVARGNNEHSGNGGMNTVKMRANTHATVKPTALMRHLVRLITPPGGTTLDPFMGSGSTGKASMLEGFNFIGIEREAEYVAISEARIKHAQAQTPGTESRPAPVKKSAAPAKQEAAQLSLLE